LDTFGFALLLLLFPLLLVAQEAPPNLDCTGPKGADAAAVLAAQQAWAKHLGEASHEKSFPLDKGGKVMIEMVLLPPGKYFRGEGNGAVVITLTQPQWAGKYEVTQQQCAALMGHNPSHFKRTALYPVEAVDNVCAVRFCDVASAHTGAEFRLLREAEWEYACRAGTRTKFYGGDAADTLDGIAQHGGNIQTAVNSSGQCWDSSASTSWRKGTGPRRSSSTAIPKLLTAGVHESPKADPRKNDLLATRKCPQPFFGSAVVLN
jgi:formylglycine-generating enzyme required for sulfatase activity